MMALFFLLVTTVALATSHTQERLRLIDGKRDRTVPIIPVGTQQYVSFQALAKAIGRFRFPDEMSTQTFRMQWSAPCFFVVLERGGVRWVLQSTLPSIASESGALVPLDECMRLLSIAGVLRWQPESRRATIIEYQASGTTQKQPPPRYDIPPRLRRPSLERLQKQSSSQTLSIRRSSPLLASAALMPLEEPPITLEHLEATFAGDTTRIVLTFDAAIPSERISVIHRGALVECCMEQVRISKKLLQPLRRIRLRRYWLDTIGTAQCVRMQLVNSERQVRSFFRSARVLVVEIVPQQIHSTRWAFDCIVLDPGHGGADIGTIGVRGTYEKHITLALAQRVTQYVRKMLPSVRVVLTRHDDRFVELHRRGKIANQNGGKLFISLHCNAAPTKPHPARGIEVYVLSPARTDQAAAVASRENASIRFESDSIQYSALSAQQHIVASVAQQGFLELSHLCAAILDSMITHRLGTVSRGVQSAGFLVLVGASMPAVLLEVGFLSNPDEEKLLRSAAYRDKLALTIAHGIAQYVRQYRRIVAIETEHR
ncbi:MAG: N-acetylmuramoyl-L-alanine amidase [Chlorobi bacterium]|nr:N-acetylmuramoyl-L-alanine amidase [Chlorobiota bacterium]